MKRTLAIADLMKERGKGGVAEQCDQYLAAEGVPFIRLDRHEQLAAKYLGFSVQAAGLPDRIVFIPARRPWRKNDWLVRTVVMESFADALAPISSAIAIEYKRPRRGRISAAQKAFDRLCGEIGLSHTFITGLDELKRIIPPKSEWMKR